MSDQTASSSKTVSIDPMVSRRAREKMELCTTRLILQVPFYAFISRHFQKKERVGMPTMAVTMDPRTMDLGLVYGAPFVDSITESQLMGCLIHEFSHLIFRHLDVLPFPGEDASEEAKLQWKIQAKDWNIAQDLAINSMILEMAQTVQGVELPPGCWIPGRPADIKPEHQGDARAQHVSKWMESLPKLLSSFEYYGLLKKEQNQNPDMWPEEVEIFMMEGAGEHELKDLPPDLLKRLKAKVTRIVKDATQSADQHSSGWGGLSQRMMEAIRAIGRPTVDWKQATRNFLEKSVKTTKRFSHSRSNRRCALVPGILRRRAAKVLLAVDQSGSVSDESLGKFFAEIEWFLRDNAALYLPFDCEAREEDLKAFELGDKVPPIRERSGGTDFSAPIKLFNEIKGKLGLDALVILTDGQAPEPIQCYSPMAWILVEGGNIDFPVDPSTPVIVMEDTKILI